MRPSVFKRLFLPGFAFKAVVIGGGYATGRELGLVVGIAAVAAFGSDSVERLFKYVTYFLYGVYAIFFGLVLVKSFGRIEAIFTAQSPMTDWAIGGATYAGYNAAAAVAVLPVLRHLTSDKDALIAGLLAGPLGMLPAVLFFVCMAAFYPDIAGATLPSDYMLQRLDAPAFHFIFQLMILAALLESGTGVVHAINERVAGVLRARGRTLSTAMRLWISGGMLFVSIFVATRFGLVTLIARGYRALAYASIAVYVAPVLTYGLWSFLRNHRTAAAAQAKPVVESAL